MTRSRRASAIWLVAVSDIVAIGLAQVFDPSPIILIVIIMTVVGSFSLVGALLATRLPGNPIGWILFLGGTVIAWAVVGVAYATHSVVTCEACLPGTVAVAALANVALIPVIGAVGVFVPLLFPDGHLPSPRWRPVAWFSLAAIGLLAVVIGVTPGPMSSGAEIRNPVGVDGFGGPTSVIGIVAIGAMLASLLLAFASVVIRFRQGDVVQRQQLRWFGYAVLVMAVLVVLGTSHIGPMEENGWIVILGGLALLPIATGVAILRYRLYDLDRLVSRTIAYVIVTGLLGAAYAGLILVLLEPLGRITGTDSTAVAVSTLVVAALFQPVRRRVQHIVDRRFDRVGFDAETTSAAFAERIRGETDIATMAGDLDTTIRTVMAPTSLSFWLRGAVERSPSAGVESIAGNVTAKHVHAHS